MLVVIRAGRLVDGTGAAARSDVDIYIRDGLIVDVEPAGEVPAEAPLLDFSAQTVLPGLIDCHTHLVFSAGSDPLRDVLAEDDHTLLLRATAAARSALAAGITTVRDLGGRGGVVLALREAIARGIVPGPRILSAGSPITITGGHCYYLGLEADGELAVRLAVRRQVKQGVNCLKIMATGGRMTPGTNVSVAQYILAELQAAVEETRRARLTIAAHALGTAGIRLAVEAGVDTIEHCSWIGPNATVEYDERVAAQMPERGVYVTPTLIPVRNASVLGDSGLTQGMREQVAMRQELLRYHRRSRELGVQFLAGTDAGVRQTPHNSLAGEIELLAREVGLPAVEAIHAATGRAAAAIGLDGQVGTIQRGRRADLIAVDGDPTRDLGALRQVRAVLQDGRVVVEHGRLLA